MSLPVRPDIYTLIDEYNQEIAKPVGSRAVTRLENLIIALQKIQDTPSSQGDLSYFYLASYHGLSSDDVFSAQRQDVPDQFKGHNFCPHGLPEFPAWHRVFLYRFEKALQSADPSVMLPFWNEVRQPPPSTGFPEIFNSPTFQKSDGTTINNSLFTFTPQDNINFGSANVDDTTHTIRDSGSLAGYLSSQISSDVKSAFKQSTYDLFSHTSDSSANALENPHNNVHGYVGGWMGLVELSAFDPIFWFHHCFIDNLFWQWQLLNNQTDKIDFDNNHLQLIPFKNNGKDYYTIGDVANVAQFGYTYPDFDHDALGVDSRNSRRTLLQNLGKGHVSKNEGSKKVLVVSGILFADFGGSFRVNATATTASGDVPLGTQTVFRFSKQCVNCDVSPTTQVSFRLKNVKESEEGNITFKVQFVLGSGSKIQFSEAMQPGARVVHKLMNSNLELVY